MFPDLQFAVIHLAMTPISSAVVAWLIDFLYLHFTFGEYSLTPPPPPTHTRCWHIYWLGFTQTFFWQHCDHVANLGL